MKMTALIFIVLALCSIGILTIISNPKSRSNLWLGIMALAPGLGVLVVFVSFLFSETILKTVSPLTIDCLFMFALYVTPYATLMFGITYSGRLKNAFHYKLTGSLLLIPVLIMFVEIPFSLTYHSFFLLYIWAIPYIIVADYLVILAYFQEKIRRQRKHKLLTCILFIPATLVIEMYNILNLPYHDIWKFNITAVISAFILFFFLSVRYGIVGVRVILERNQLAGTIRSVTSGTLILNHAIKNELTKMAVCMENIKRAAQKPEPNITGINQNTQFVQDSLGYLALMVKKIQSQVEEIVITKKPTNLAEVAAKALQILILPLREKNIRVINEIAPSIRIPADGFHLQEVLINIIKNAIDAMKIDGTLYLGLLEEKRAITLVIRDDGTGIEKENLPHVLEPFFTTKSRHQNFGLGLTYCYNVLQKHGGTLEIESVENSGTTVLLTFPIVRFGSAKYSFFEAANE